MQMQRYQMQGQPVSMNHGGHEMFDAHEVLSGMINVLDQFMIFRQYVQDPELVYILDRQYQHILNEYNQWVQTFTTGQAPMQQKFVYQTHQQEQVIYGITPSSPKKPNQTLSDIQDKGISGHMLGLIKSMGSLLAMSAVEISNPHLRRGMAQCVPSFVEMAYEIFLYQNKHRYYQVPQLNSQDMQQMLSAYAPVSF